MKMYYCYEDCLHAGQLFEGGKFYPFQSEDQLPWRHPAKKGGKKTIAHFEEVQQPLKPGADEKEVEAKVKKIKDSWGIKKLSNEVKAMRRIEKPTPADLRYITMLETKIASIEGEVPIAPTDIRHTVIPEL